MLIFHFKSLKHSLLYWVYSPIWIITSLHHTMIFICLYWIKPTCRIQYATRVSVHSNYHNKSITNFPPVSQKLFSPPHWISELCLWFLIFPTYFCPNSLHQLPAFFFLKIFIFLNTLSKSLSFISKALHEFPAMSDKCLLLTPF